MRIAFFAPMKPADHPTPSGDRRMAQLLLAALTNAGHDVEVASRMRTYLPVPDSRGQADIRAWADQEGERIAAAWSREGTRCDLWFTYHNYHKAPDLLGPDLARRFRLPYLLAEASRARKRAATWGAWYAAAEASIAAADVHLCFTSRDRSGILPATKSGARLFDLPPFIDARAYPPARRWISTDEPSLIAVAMMRPGDKLESFALLAAALEQIQDIPWRLTLVGDGPARNEVEGLFAAIAPARLRWAGALASDAVLRELDRADIYAWPGLGEAFGLGFLEGQAMGLPVAAIDTAGVASVVRHGSTGLLACEISAQAFAAVLRRLCLNPEERSSMGCAAADWVQSERTLDAASSILSQAVRAAADARTTDV